MAESNLSVTASEADKVLVGGSLENAEITDNDYMTFVDINAPTNYKMRKTPFSQVIEKIKTFIIGLPPATASDVGKTVLVQRDGSYGLGASSGGTLENVLFATSDWQVLSNNSPFTYFAQKTLNTQIFDNTRIVLVNDQPITFAKYGIVIAEPPANQTIKFYALQLPVEQVILRLRINA